MKQPRYSPSSETQQNYLKSQERGTKGNHLPQQYTVCSSQNNLVVYDSQHTELFKSKQFGKRMAQYGRVGRIDFGDHQNSNNNFSDIEGLAKIPSSCPSLDDDEGNQIADNLDGYGEGIFGQTLDEDPFVTGRFCDNSGGQTKQFLFKYSNNNSKNSTLRAGQHFLNQ